MAKQSVSTSDAPHIILEIYGNLHLKGEDSNEVIARTDSPNNLRLEGQGEQVRVQGQSNTEVRVPRDASVEIEMVNGNAEVRALEGELRIHEMNGNLDLRRVGVTHLDRLHGNLYAKSVDGDLHISTVKGNVTVRDVTGSFSVENEIDGNLSLDDVTGKIIARADGNLLLRFDPFPGQKYEFTCRGNIVCRLPEDASAQVHITRGRNILVKVGEVHRSGKNNIPFDVTLGDGDAELFFSADGNVQITGQAPDWEMGNFGFEIGGEFENIAEQISQQIESQVGMIEEQIAAQMEQLAASLGSTGLTPEQAERIAQRAREASARATARAQERMQQAQERIKRKMEAVQRRAEQKARAAERRAPRSERRSWSFEWPAPPARPVRPPRSAAPEPAEESVSDEERLIILRMLEQKKITAEEAEQLLAALESQGG